MPILNKPRVAGRPIILAPLIPVRAFATTYPAVPVIHSGWAPIARLRPSVSRETHPHCPGPLATPPTQTKHTRSERSYASPARPMTTQSPRLRIPTPVQPSPFAYQLPTRTTRRSPAHPASLAITRSVPGVAGRGRGPPRDRSLPQCPRAAARTGCREPPSLARVSRGTMSRPPPPHESCMICGHLAEITLERPAMAH